MSATGIGASPRRKEDFRFITGKGNYTDDINRAGQTHAYFVRSPHAHAAIGGIDASAALAMPGVVAVLTGQDLADDGIGGLICGWMVHSKDGSPMKVGPHPALAQGKVRYAGDCVAVVIAETHAQAKDAAEAVAVDYRPLPAIVDAKAALADGAPLVHDEIAHNLAFDWEIGNYKETVDAFATAAKVVTLDIVNNRLIPNAMEPRAALGDYDGGTGIHTLHTTSQNPHVARLVLSAFIGVAPEHKLRVIAPDVGGGFGSKIFIYAEETVCVWAARRVGRPVKWTGERSEGFQADADGRDMRTRAEAALDADGKLLAVRITGSGNMGGYLSHFAVFIPTLAGGRIFGGVYRVPALFANIKCWYTNTGPIDAYRGAGRPEAAYLMERLMDRCAAAAGLDPVEIRRRNLLEPGDLPRSNWAGIAFDSGLFHRNLELALEKADYASFEARRAAAAAEGKLRGFGVAYYVEITAGGGKEPAVIRFNDNGGVDVYLGTQSNGQGHETSFAQIVAERLGVPFESVTVRQGDSFRDIDGGGTGGSRSLHMSGGAILSASDEVIAKGKLAASHVLEAAPADIEFAVVEGKGGQFAIAGTDRTVSIGEVAQAAKRQPIEGLEDGIDATSTYQSTNSTFPNGAHLCEVEIDPETGVTRIERYTVVDDFGRVINPMIVAGQVHGGIVQGIGQALIENCVYDAESGQLLTGSFMDYGMPRADDVPNFDLTFCEDAPSPSNPLGVKGCGEAGTVGALAAVMNAVADAVKVRGIDHIDMPATPLRVWEALQSAA
jgi:carbon-monoxide dehydrogenase large subunit